MIARFLVALLALAFCFEAEAKEGWEAFGSGTKSCADWTNAQAERRPISSGCAAHPLDPIANAAIALVAELSKRQSGGAKPK